MCKVIIVLCSIVFSMSVAAADSIDVPNVKPGDKWVCKTITESGRTGWVEKHKEFIAIRSTPSSILLSINEVGSTLPPAEQLVGADWSMFRNIGGEEVIVNQPLKFPLKEGKSWGVDFSEDHPSKDRKKQHIHLDYRVVGWEDIVVPAGKFKALKVEAEGNWKADIEPSVGATTSTKAGPSGLATVMQTNKTLPRTVTGRMYKAFWYEPAVKRFVKAIEEDFNAQGARNGRYTMELESFKVAE